MTDEDNSSDDSAELDDSALEQVAGGRTGGDTYYTPGLPGGTGSLPPTDRSTDHYTGKVGKVQPGGPLS